MNDAPFDLAPINERGQDYLPGLLGITFTHAEHGRMTAEMVIRPDLLAPNGFLHAASIIALADTACGYGAIFALPQGAFNFTTIELKSNFLGTLTEGIVMCEAKAEHLGRTSQVWDAIVTGKGTGKRLALFRCTQMVLWPKT